MTNENNRRIFDKVFLLAAMGLIIGLTIGSGCTTLKPLSERTDIEIASQLAYAFDSEGISTKAQFILDKIKHTLEGNPTELHLFSILRDFSNELEAQGKNKEAKMVSRVVNIFYLVGYPDTISTDKYARLKNILKLLGKKLESQFTVKAATVGDNWIKIWGDN